MSSSLKHFYLVNYLCDRYNNAVETLVIFDISDILKQIEKNNIIFSLSVVVKLLDGSFR